MLWSIHEIRSFVMCAVFFGALTGTSVSATELPNLPTVIILDIEAEDITPSGRRILWELLRDEITKGDSLHVVPANSASIPLPSDGLADDTTNSLPRTDESTVPLPADKAVSCRISRLGRLFIIKVSLTDLRTDSVERDETVEFIGDLEELRRPLRAIAQRLVQIGGSGVDSETVLRVRTVPAGARVYVSGLYEGISPVTVRCDSGGTYSVRIVLEGYTGWSGDTRVLSGETTELHAKLYGDEAGQQDSLASGPTGRAILMTYMIPYAMVASEAILYVAGVSSARPYIGAPLVAAPVTYFAMLRNVDENDVSVGRASMIASSASWGGGWGLMGMMVLSTDNSYPRATVGIGLGVSLTSMVIAMEYTRLNDISLRRVKLINFGGFMGSALGLGIPYLLNVDNGTVYLGSLLFGGVLGTLSAAVATAETTGPAHTVPATTASGWRFMTLQRTVSAVDALRSRTHPNIDPGIRMVLAEYRFF
jgi:hypothetical protein